MQPRQTGFLGRALLAGFACALAAALAGCGSSDKHASTTTTSAGPRATIETCLRRHGYRVRAEPSNVRATAPANFEFVTIWNLLNPHRIALTMTFSKSAGGASRAAVWTRNENKKLGKSVVHAPVAQFGRIDVLWTAQPNKADMDAIYGCVKATS